MGRTITETDIVTHAMHSGDFYPHHTDAEFAKKGPFGQRIAQFSCTFSIGIALTASIVIKEHLLMVLKDYVFQILFSLEIQFIPK